MNKKTLISYLDYHAVSNDEHDFSQFIIKKMLSYKNIFTSDKLGNLYFDFHDNSQNKKQKHLCICIHIDEPGLLISNISKTGLIFFICQGRFRLFNLINTQVRLVTADKKSYIGTVQYFDKATSSVAELNNARNYFVDFGFQSKEEVINKHKISPGQTMHLMSNARELTDNRIIGKNLNNRVSVAAVIENLASIIKDTAKNKIHLTIAMIVQKQIGNRGANVVPYNVDADLYLNLDAFNSNETVVENSRNIVFNTGKIHGGPCLMIYDPSYITKKNVQIFLENIANFHKIRFQYVFLRETSNCGALSLATSGQLILPIGFTYRYGLGPTQMIDFADIALYEKWLLAIVAKLSATEINVLIRPIITHEG